MANMAVNKLNVKQISKLPPGRHSDGNGLYLMVRSEHSRSWIFRFTLNGKTKEMGFGSANVTSLAEARDMAINAKRLIRDGIDPKLKRDGEATAMQAAAEKQARLEANPVATFKEHALHYMAKKEDEWQSDVYRRQWYQSLKDYAYPIIGHIKPKDITLDDIGMVLNQKKEDGTLWENYRETASRLRGRIEKILNYAIARDPELDVRTRINPANLKLLQDGLILTGKAPVVTHHPHMPYPLLPDFMAKLVEMDSVRRQII